MFAHTELDTVIVDFFGGTGGFIAMGTYRHHFAGINRGSLFDPSFGINSDPAASKGARKSFILDPLLDSR